MTDDTNTQNNNLTMNNQNIQPENTNLQGSPNSNGSGFTPSTASFNLNNQGSGMQSLNPEMTEKSKDDAAEIEDIKLNTELGLVIPAGTLDEELFLYNSFFYVIRNMFRWKMLQLQEITQFNSKFVPLSLDKKGKIISGLEAIYNQKLIEIGITDSYYDEQEDLEKWQDLFDSLDPVSQEKLIYLIQNNQEMPSDLLAKVVEEEIKVNFIEDEGEALIVDEEAEAYARKNIEKVLRSRGFSASTLTAKDVSDLVNQRGSDAVVRPNVPPVRVPSRPVAPIAGNIPSNNLTNNVPNNYSNNLGNNFANNNQYSNNLPSSNQSMQSNQGMQPDQQIQPSFQPSQQNLNSPNGFNGQNSQPTNQTNNQVNQNIAQRPPGLGRPTKGLDDLLNR